MHFCPPHLSLIVSQIKYKHLHVAHVAVLVWLLRLGLISSPTSFPSFPSSSHIGLSGLWESRSISRGGASHRSVWNVRPPGLFMTRSWCWRLSELKPHLFREAVPAQTRWTQTFTPPHHSLSRLVPVFNRLFSADPTGSLPN